MTRLSIVLALALTSLNAMACDHRVEICQLMQQVERGQSGSALPRLVQIAEHGDIQAQLALGALYGTGKGIPQDDGAALQWLKKAAQAGDRSAQAIVGNFYATGGGVDVDLKEARQWYEKAAARGDPDSQYMLGLLFARGEGAPLDYRSAYFWFGLSALAGDKKAAKYRDMLLPYLSEGEVAAAKADIAKWQPSQ